MRLMHGAVITMPEGEVPGPFTQIPATSAVQYVRIIGAVDSSVKLRTTKYAGVDHLVVPVVAMVGNAVIRPMHSAGPEFVPSSELALAAAQWNGRPVVPDHPNNGHDSANTPSTHDAAKYGVIFNARFEDSKLKMDAFLDVARAKDVGAGWVIDKFEAGEMVEISVGAWVRLEAAAGLSPDGIPYEYRWSHILSDHLAIGLNGTRGACSVDMGCGALRTNKESVMSAIAPLATESPALVAARQIAVTEKTAYQFRTHAAPSDIQLRDLLYDALRAVEPGFGWIQEVFPKRSGGSVVYAAMPADRIVYYQRSFSMADSKVDLSDDRTEVVAQTEWKPASTATEHSHESAGSGCQCQHTNASNQSTAGNTVVTTEAAQGPEGAIEQMADPVIQATPTPAAAPVATPASAAAAQTPAVTDQVKSLVTSLIACAAAPFTEAQRAAMEQWPAETLTNLDTIYKGLASPQPVTSAAAVSTEEQWLANAPPSIRALVSRQLAAEAQEKAVLVQTVTKLQGAGAFTVEQLNAKPNEELRTLAKALGAVHAVDYSVVGVPVPTVSAAAGGQGYPEAPADPWGVTTKKSTATQ